MFGKVMSIPDAMMYRYYELCTDLSTSQIERLKTEIADGRQHPRTVKAELAKSIICDFHSADAAREAELEFNRIYQKGILPDELEIKNLPLSPERLRLPKLIAKLGLADSVAEANRLVEQGAVTLNGEKIMSLQSELDPSRPGTYVLKVGKRRFMKLIVGS